MDITTLTSFFLWCSVINGGLLFFWTITFLAAPNLVFRTQSAFFSLERKTFDLVFYCFIALFKILFLLFNLVPLIALMIIG